MVFWRLSCMGVYCSFVICETLPLNDARGCLFGKDGGGWEAVSRGLLGD